MSLVSSAKDDTLASVVSLSISLMKIRKRMGPSTVPCGTPLLTLELLDLEPSAVTMKDRFVKKFQP